MGNLNYPQQSYFIGTERKPVVISFPKITKVFQTFVGQSNYLDLATYNKCIDDITNHGNFPKLAYTYLNERCYEMVTNNNQIPLTCERFAQALLTALSHNEMRCLILFNAMKRNTNQNYLTFADILDFFKKSWERNFKYIYDYINYCLRDEFIRRQIVIPNNLQDLYGLIGLHEDDLKNYLISSLYDSGIIDINGRIGFDLFKNWAIKDNNTEITYGGACFKFANTLNFMSNIGVDTKAT